MLKQMASPAFRHSSGLAGVLAGATVWLLFLGSPAAHAGDGGLLDDATQVVEGATEQVVEPVADAVQSPVPPLVEQAAEPVVQQAVVPTAPEPEKTVKATVRAAEQTVEPVVEVITSTTRSAGERVEAVDRVLESAAAPAPQRPVSGAPAGSVDAQEQGGGEHVAAGTQGPGDEQHPQPAADRTDLPDLAPRAVARPSIDPPHSDDDDPSPDRELWALTEALMRMWAGEYGPGAVNAGLAGHGETGPRTPETSAVVPLLLGLLLGLLLCFLSLVLARRRLA